MLKNLTEKLNKTEYPYTPYHAKNYCGKLLIDELQFTDIESVQLKKVLM
jgi:hypothetical protein